MTSDMYEDMGKLNALYAELMWDHEDELEFVPDYNLSLITHLTLPTKA